MSKGIKRILGIISVFVLFFSLVSVGSISAQTQGLTMEEEYNLDNEYDQPVLYKEEEPTLYDSPTDSSVKRLNSECKCEFSDLGRSGVILISFIFFFTFAVIIASLVFNIVMIVDCINRDEKELKDRTVWLVILIVGAFMGFGLIASLVYFFAVKKKLEENEKSERKDVENSQKK